MSVATVHLCDHINCQNVAKLTCTLCLKDICTQHVAQRGRAGIRLDSPNMVTPIVDTDNELFFCLDCSKFLKLKPGTDVKAISALLDAALEAYMVELRVAWTEGTLRSKPAQAATVSDAVTVYVGDPPGSVSEASTRGAPSIGLSGITAMLGTILKP